LLAMSHAVSSKKEKPSRLLGLLLWWRAFFRCRVQKPASRCADERNAGRDFIMRLVINGRRLRNLVISGEYICPGIRKCAAGRVTWS
jgi:hypothetical protein